MRRIVVVVGLGALALAAACASLSGLSGGDGERPNPVEAGSEAAPPAEAAPPPDPCSHASYPPPPAKDDDPTGEIPALVLAVRDESVNGSFDAGAQIGFDLDGVCTCFPDTTTAHGGDPSCIAPKGGALACDGDGGADSQIATVLAAYTVPNNAGYAGPTLLLKITRYNGRANDRQVFVAIVPSPGVFDATGCGDAGDTADAGRGPYTPTWQGCDHFSVDSDSVLPNTSEPTTFISAYVTDHVLVITPTARPITFVVGNTTLSVSSSVMTARLTAVDAQLRPIVPQPDVGQLFRVDGISAGRVNTGDALRSIASGQAQTDGGPLCGFPNFFNTVKNSFVCPSADIATDPANDFKNAGCDALSLAVAFTAEPAFFGDVRKPPQSACGDPADPQYAPFFDCAK
ncbi:MAG: hypothetical protein QOI41_227 [Myxococcales bacterium]|nr:hypothetical protein [Myxococcales bacterium]